LLGQKQTGQLNRVIAKFKGRGIAAKDGKQCGHGNKVQCLSDAIKAHLSS
jgi:hypothetical protein